MPNEFSLSDTTYGKFKNVSQYNVFLKNKNIFLKLGKEDVSLIKFEENNLTEFDRHLTIFLGERWNENYAFHFPTNEEKINLFKGLVLLERFNNSGGSVAANIRVFGILEKSNLVTPDLLDWTFKNKSDNPYTPFGWARYGHVRSYKEYLQFLDDEALKARIHNETESQNIANKKKRIIEKAKKHKEKMEMTKLFNLVLYAKRDEYLKDESKDILKDIINKKLEFPIFIFPDYIIKKLTQNLVKLDEENLQKLIQIIPRKSPSHIKELREQAILIKKNTLKNKFKSLFLFISSRLKFTLQH